MSAYLIAILIAVCGIVLGAIAMYFYMDGRVEFWQERFTMERRLKEAMMKLSAGLLQKQLSVLHDLSGAFKK